MTQEVLKLSQEALAGLKDVEKQVRELVAENKALKEALAQTEREYERGFIDGMQKQMQSSVDKAVNRMAQTQEPVAWMDADGNVSDNNDHKCFPIPLYTTPPQRAWVGLTEEEIEDAWRKVETGDFHDCVLPFAQAIEAELKGKNHG